MVVVVVGGGRVGGGGEGFGTAEEGGGEVAAVGLRTESVQWRKRPQVKRGRGGGFILG